MLLALMNQFNSTSISKPAMVNDYPAFNRFVENIFAKSPMQKRYLAHHFAKRDGEFFGRAEKFATGFVSYLNEMGLTIDQAVDAYLEVCTDMVTNQMSFRKTKKYSCQSAKEAEAHVYSSNKKMMNYMVGLILSQFLWPNHYAIYDFFIEQSRKLKDIKSILEIGPGHGLYLAESISFFTNAQVDAIDISPTSKTLSESLVFHFTGGTRCNVQIKDINDLDYGQYDYIVMGEVLEHLDDPKFALRRIYNLLNEDGYFFLTTCANAPAIDHVYLYESVEHIQRHIRENDFVIISELALPVEDVPEEQWVEKHVEVNYAAMLKK